MPRTEASACRLTTHPTANVMSPVTSVNTAREFSSGCLWPSSFSVRKDTFEREVAVSGISAILRGSRRARGDHSRPRPALCHHAKPCTRRQDWLGTNARTSTLGVMVPPIGAHEREGDPLAVAETTGAE